MTTATSNRGNIILRIIRSVLRPEVTVNVPPPEVTVEVPPPEVTVNTPTPEVTVNVPTPDARESEIRLGLSVVQVFSNEPDGMQLGQVGPELLKMRDFWYREFKILFDIEHEAVAGPEIPFDQGAHIPHLYLEQVGQRKFATLFIDMARDRLANDKIGYDYGELALLAWQPAHLFELMSHELGHLLGIQGHDDETFMHTNSNQATDLVKAEQRDQVRQRAYLYGTVQ